ncbi:hypothetical protein [Actinoplanes friuliensis]|jgi:hypothetical protein|uniref:Uncharacterized protein n=1 Tax=Actinoplanes friuliensis DSM 7358 TaxID=1246995 RepID=U5W072_9ACTN|nr:hypothetical protein [Actinoplanes friuliensis]AGZ41316.1 hypothetical protein AFR_15170 [Actinoplanes friuliensis DSM 7358]
MINSAADRPPMLEAGASLLAVVGVFSAGRVAYGVVTNLGQNGWSTGARGVFLVLNAIVLIFALFILVLAWQVRRGRTWAWVVSLVLLPFTIFFGGLLLLITALNDMVPFAGIGVVLFSLAALLTLTVPRSVRDHLLRKPAPAMQWAPGHPPAD